MESLTQVNNVTMEIILSNHFFHLSVSYILNQNNHQENLVEMDEIVFEKSKMNLFEFLKMVG